MGLQPHGGTPCEDLQHLLAFQYAAFTLGFLTLKLDVDQGIGLFSGGAFKQSLARSFEGRLAVGRGGKSDDQTDRLMLLADRTGADDHLTDASLA